MTKGQFVYLGIMGALALLSYAFPALILYGFFLAIVPGVVLLVAIPLFGYSVLAITVRNLGFALPLAWRWGLVALSLALLAVVPPRVINHLTDHRIAELQNGDRRLNQRLPPIKTLAYISLAQNDAAFECREICQRLLFNGSVESVIVGGSLSRRQAEFPKKVEKYSIEHRATCPPVEVPKASATREPWVGEAAAKAVAAHVTTRIAGGDCLIREPGSLDAADVVVIEYLVDLGNWQKWQKDYPRISSAQRVGIFVRGGHRLDEKFRQTSVSYRKVSTPFLFGYFGAAGSGALLPPLGIMTTREIDAPYEIADIITGVLKLNVAIPESVANQRSLLRQALADASRPADDAGLKLAGPVLADIRSSGAQQGDVALLGTIIADHRVGLPFDLANSVARLGPEGSVLAEPLVERILSTRLPDDRNSIYAASAAAIALPPGAFSDQRAKLLAIIAQPERSDMAFMALARLADSGAANVPMLRDRLRGKGDIRGALMALCRLGESAKDAEPEVRTIVQGGGPNPNYSLAQRTLVRISGPSNPAPEPTADQRRGVIDTRPERARTDAVSVACRP